jgi:hypothetical protein
VFTGEEARSTGMSVDLNQWQHVAAVFIPGTGVRFYKNGVSVLIPFIGYDTSDADVRVAQNQASVSFSPGELTKWRFTRGS